jgi:hypothetical protein
MGARAMRYSIKVGSQIIVAGNKIIYMLDV